MILLFVLGFGTKLGSVSLSQSFGHLSPWELDLECDTSVFEGSLVSLPHIFCIFEFAKLSGICSGSGVMVVSKASLVPSLFLMMIFFLWSPCSTVS